MHSSSFYPFLVISSPARGQAVRLWACSSGEATLGDIEHMLMSSSGASELAGDDTCLAAIGSPAPSGLQAALPRWTAWARSLSLRARGAPPLLATPGAPPIPSSLPGHGTPRSSLPTAAELCGVDGPHCGQLPTEARRADGGAGQIRRRRRRGLGGATASRPRPSRGAAAEALARGAGASERAWQALRLGPLAPPISLPLCLAAGRGACWRRRRRCGDGATTWRLELSTNTKGASTPFVDDMR